MHVYYQVFRDHQLRESLRPCFANSRLALARLSANALAPPRNVATFKGAIARLESLDREDVIQLFTSTAADSKPLPDDSAMSNLGVVVDTPVSVVVTSKGGPADSVESPLVKWESLLGNFDVKKEYRKCSNSCCWEYHQSFRMV
jgi:hypothetical protein